MADRVYHEHRAHQDQGGSSEVWIKLRDNGDGTHSIAAYDAAVVTRLTAIEALLTSILAKLNGTISVDPVGGL